MIAYIPRIQLILALAFMIKFPFIKSVAFSQLLTIILLSVYFKSLKIALLLILPRKQFSYAFGKLMKVHFPKKILSLIINFWVSHFHVILSDMTAPLNSYTSMSDFFNRRIDISHRSITKNPSPNSIYAPADSVLTQISTFDDQKSKVKGFDFTLEQLISEPVSGRFAFCVFYLSPGDFHDFMAFNDFHSSAYKLIQGDLMPVNALFTGAVKGLLAVQERVCITGEFGGRKCFYVPVGALNVGNIVLNKCKVEGNNGGEKEWKVGNFYENGKSIGMFKLGSTVVIAFELQENEQLEVVLEGKVQIGQECIRINKID